MFNNANVNITVYHMNNLTLPVCPKRKRTFANLKTLLPLFLLCFAAFSGFAQTEKGFKALEKEDWKDAIKYFSKDTIDPEKRVAALYGLAKTLTATKNPAKDYYAAMKHQVNAILEWEELSPRQQKLLNDEFKVSETAIARVRSSSEAPAWRAVERKKNLTLQDLNDYVNAFPYPEDANIRVAINQKRGDLVQKAVADADTYAELSALLRQNRSDIEEYSLDALKAMDARVLDLFLQEKGPDWLGQFYAENPGHPLFFDTGKIMFPEVYGTDDFPAMLQFLYEYPNSYFTPIVSKQALKYMEEYEIDSAYVRTLSTVEKAALGELEMAARGELIDPTEDYEDSKYQKWLNYVRKLAPSEKAEMAFDKMAPYYIQNRNWKRASEVLHTGRLVFPHRAAEMNRLIPIIDGPEYGIKVKPVADVINKEGSQYVPVPSTNQKTLYFCATGREDNLGGEDIFVSYRRDTGWTKPTVVQNLSGYSNQAPLSLAADGNSMVLFDQGKPKISKKTSTGWSKPDTLDIDLSGFRWVGLTQIAANNKIMVFEASKQGMVFFGSDIDIYIAERMSDGKWGKPFRLDTVINTPEQDRSPFLHPDMRTLYYSTAGKGGLGGMDVYKTTRIGDSWTRWTTPVNIGKELNTMNDDWAYKVSTDGTTAWFSRRNEDGIEQDIYYATLPENVRPEAIKVVNVKTGDKDGKPIIGKVVVKDPVSGKVIGEYDTNPTGTETSIPVPNDKDYTVTLEKEGYFPTAVTVQKTNDTAKPVETNVDLKPLSVEEMVKQGLTAELNLFFDYNSAELRPESFDQLRKVADIAKTRKLSIKLMGYSDNIGGADFNLQLSQKRAEAARMALISLGIDTQRISAKGFGQANPIADNDTEANRAKNRRVEVQYVAE